MTQAVRKPDLDDESAVAEDLDGLDLLRGPGLRPEVMADFRKHANSPLGGVFGGMLFDEIALLPIAAAVDQTGRFSTNFIDRGLQSPFAVLPVMAGTVEQRRQAAADLIDKHKVVHGHGVGEYADVRYSALEPGAWLWIIASGVHMLMTTFPLCTGHQLRPAEAEAAYQYARLQFSVLELPSSRGKLPPTLEGFTEYYEHTAATQFQSNGLLRDLYYGLTKLPLPTFGVPAPLRVVLTPAWLVARPALGHVLQVCAAKAMHPALREAIGIDMKPGHDLEFHLYVALVQAVWQVVPHRFLLEPVAYEEIRLDEMRERLGDSADARRKLRRAQSRAKFRQDKLLAFYKKFELKDYRKPGSETDSAKAARAAAGCPV